MPKLANCPLCQSDQVYVVSGVSFGVKCCGCWHVKVQCFDSKEEAIEAWNTLFKDQKQETINQLIRLLASDSPDLLQQTDPKRPTKI